MAKIYIDPGHGGSDPGASKGNLIEKQWVLEVSLELAGILRNLGHSVRLARTNDTFVSLNGRSADANRWGADIFVSVHFNAGGGYGWEDFIFNGKISNNTKRLQNDIHNAIKPILSKHGLKNRGKKTANFSVLRQTSAPAILIEAGFVDTTDNAILRKSSYKKDVALGVANGIQKYFGLGKVKDVSPSTPTTSSPKGTIYRVQLGAFAKKSNADALSKEVKSKAKTDTHIFKSDNLYRVQVGAYAQKANADNQLKKMKVAGFKDAFITTNGTTTSAPAKPAPRPTPTLSVNQMARKVINDSNAPTGDARAKWLGVSLSKYKNEVQPEINKILGVSSSSGGLTVNQMASKVINDSKAPTGDARAKWLGISVKRYRNEVQPEINRILGGGSSTSASKPIVNGSRVKIKSSASRYATGERIPSSVKNKTYTIMQVKSDRVLLREIMSWVKKNDVV